MSDHSGSYSTGILCQGVRGHRYHLPIDGIASVVDDDAGLVLVQMSRGSAPFRVVGTAAEILALLPAGHAAHFSFASKSDVSLESSRGSSAARPVAPTKRRRVAPAVELAPDADRAGGDRTADGLQRVNGRLRRRWARPAIIHGSAALR